MVGINYIISSVILYPTARSVFSLMEYKKQGSESSGGPGERAHPLRLL